MLFLRLPYTEEQRGTPFALLAELRTKQGYTEQKQVFFPICLIFFTHLLENTTVRLYFCHRLSEFPYLGISHKLKPTQVP